MTPTAANVANLDTGVGLAFVAEGSPVRRLLRAYVQGKAMIMCQTALAEFQNAVAKYGGPLEQARAGRFIAGVRLFQTAHRSGCWHFGLRKVSGCRIR